MKQILTLCIHKSVSVLILLLSVRQHDLLLSSNRNLVFICKSMKKRKIVESLLFMGSIFGFSE